MPKFNPHPLFPENPLYEIHSEAEIPHSDRYELCVMAADRPYITQILLTMPL